MSDTLKEIFESGASALTQENGLNDKSTSRLDALILLLHCANLTKEQYYTHPELHISRKAILKYHRMIDDRKNGYCTAALIGCKEFYKYSFQTSKHTLIPRSDSEILVEIALDQAEKHSGTVHILDLCTGTGCIGISIAKDLQEKKRKCELTLSDISKRALKIAELNCASLNVEAKTIESDLFAKMKGCKYDIITANPPYVSKNAYARLKAEVLMEPKRALVAEDDGFAIVRRIITNSPFHMTPEACLIIEMDPDQTNAAADLAVANGFEQVEIFKDLAGRSRGIKGSIPK